MPKIQRHFLHVIVDRGQLSLPKNVLFGALRSAKGFEL